MAAKRGQGEGSIYWCEDRKRYRAAITLPNGKHKFVSARTKKEVQEELHSLLHAQQQGTLTVAPKQTVATYLEGWLELRRRTVRERTWVRYREITRKHVIPGIGRRHLDKLTAQDVDLFYHECEKSGVTASMVRHIHRVLRAALNAAVRKGLLSRNPVVLADPPRAPRPQHRTLSQDEGKRLLAALKGHPYEALYLLEITTGMREEELFGLKWDVVDLDNAVLEVRRCVFQLAGKGATWGEPKSRSSRRRLPLAPPVVAALREHRDRQQRQRAARLERGRVWTDQDIVFPNRLGGPMHAANFLRRVHYPLLEQAKIPKLTFHELRHSTATLLFAMGVHPKVVQELLGHSAIGITLDTYTHTVPTLQADAVNSLAELLQGAAS